MALVASIRWVMLARADFPLRPRIVLGPDGGCNRYGDQGAGGGDAGRVPRHSTESPEAVVRRVRARMRLNSSSRSVWPATRIDGLIFLFSRSRSPTPPSRRPGPAITHIHVHDPETGRGSHDPALFRDVVEQVRASDTEPPRPRSMSMRGSFSPRRGDDRCSRDSPISVRGSGPDGPKSGAMSFRNGLLLGVVRQHVRIIHYNTVKYEHFGRIKARAVTGDSRKTLSAYRKALSRFVTNTQGCANRIVYQGCSSVYCHEIGQRRENLQAMHVCTANHFGRHRLYADQPDNLRAGLCSEFQCDWLEIVNEGFAFNYTPYVIRTPRTCRDDDSHRKREDLDHQSGTADEGGLSAHFRVLVCSCCGMSTKSGSARKSKERRAKRRGAGGSCQDVKCPSYERTGLSSSSLMASFI